MAVGEEPAGNGTIVVVPHGCRISYSYEEISEEAGTSEGHHWKSERLRDADGHRNCHRGKADTNVNTSNTLSKPQTTSDNLHLSQEVELDNADEDGDQIYEEVSMDEGNSKPDEEVDELERIPQ